MAIRNVFDIFQNKKFCKKSSFNEFMGFLNKPNFDPNICNSDHIDYSDHLLLYCAAYSKATGRKFLETLLKKKPNLDLQNINGFTALHLAVQDCNEYSTENTIKRLINAGANLDIQNKYGYTALMFASRFSNESSSENAVSILIYSGANLNVQNNSGNTALHLAVINHKKNSSIETVKILLEAGADPNIRNKKNQIAIDMTDNILIQLLLLKAGSEISETNKALIKYKIRSLKIKIVRYKKLLNELELELLNSSIFNSTEESIARLKDLELYLKNIKKMIKLRPGSNKVKEIEKDFLVFSHAIKRSNSEVNS